MPKIYRLLKEIWKTLKVIQNLNRYKFMIYNFFKGAGSLGKRENVEGHRGANSTTRTNPGEKPLLICQHLAECLAAQLCRIKRLASDHSVFI